VHRLVASDLVALIEEKDPLEKTAGTDIHLRLSELERFRQKKNNYGDKRLLDRIERLAQSWRRLLKVEWTNEIPPEEIAGKLIAAAYPERIAKQVERNKPLYKLANGKSAKLPENDRLITDEWIAIATMDAGGTVGKIFSAAAIDLEDVKHRAKHERKIDWDERSGKIIAQDELNIGRVTLSSKILHNVSAEVKAKLICDVIKKEGLSKYGWNAECEQWQARVMSLRNWNSSELWPDVSDAELLATVELWLPPFLSGVNSRDEMRKLNWVQIAESILPWELQQQLNQLAPQKFSVPSGSAVNLIYFPNGKAPELHVRLQEVFGMKETPAVNNGKIKIVLHLLSPGFKPVQVTQDLSSFWKNVYFEVRKELQRRYPKHSWPENPLEAQAIRGPKKRR
jgi:ATP-dependent helicase HrpB